MAVQEYGISNRTICLQALKRQEPKVLPYPVYRWALEHQPDEEMLRQILAGARSTSCDRNAAQIDHADAALVEQKGHTAAFKPSLAEAGRRLHRSHQ